MRDREADLTTPRGWQGLCRTPDTLTRVAVEGPSVTAPRAPLPDPEEAPTRFPGRARFRNPPFAERADRDPPGGGPRTCANRWSETMQCVQQNMPSDPVTAVTPWARAGDDVGRIPPDAPGFLGPRRQEKRMTRGAMVVGVVMGAACGSRRDGFAGDGLPRLSAPSITPTPCTEVRRRAHQPRRRGDRLLASVASAGARWRTCPVPVQPGSRHPH